MYSVFSDLMREKERVLNRPLSFAEEIKLLATTAEMNTGMTDSTNHGNVDVCMKFNKINTN